MHGTRRLCLSLLAAILLTGCGTRMESAQGIQPSGPAFSKHLYQGYLELSKSEYDGGDYQDSDNFAERAIAAGSGSIPEPEKLEARNLPPQETAALMVARERLVATLAAGAAEKQPEQAAKAQVSFDCWMEEQEENRQGKNIATCRDGFLTSVNYLEDNVIHTSSTRKLGQNAGIPKPGKVEGYAVTESVGAPTKLSANQVQQAKIDSTRSVGSDGRSFVIYFDMNESQLSQDAIATLMEVVLSASQAKISTIEAEGHSDTTGAWTYNQELSRKRADAVARFLIESGIDKTMIETAGRGAARPAIATPPDTPEPRNRRVEIKLE